MSVYRPKRKAEASKFYICEFVIQCKRIQESTGTTSKTVAKEYEKRRRAELERAAVGMPTEQKANRIRTVAEVVIPYLDGYELNHRAKSVLFSKGRLEHVWRVLGTVLLSDLTEDRILGYIRQRQGEKVSGRTINMEVGELSRAIGHPWSLLWPKVRKLEERKNAGPALSSDEQHRLLDGTHEPRDAGALFAHSNGGKAGSCLGSHPSAENRTFRGSPCDSPCSGTDRHDSVICK